MITYPSSNRITVPQIKARKNKIPIVALTAGHAALAQIADLYCDILLVGDSLGMVVYGMDTTISVTSELIIAHAKAVVKNSKKALVVVDMPFSTYEENPQHAFRNAAKIMQKTGCNAVKLEGGIEMAETVKFLVKRGIPVMGHVGLTPQHVNIFGGFKTQGKTHESTEIIEKNAKAIAKSGAFALVIEGVVESLAAHLTNSISIPTIGIGASSQCDGQILVMEDMLGINPFVPQFVRHYADIKNIAEQAFFAYAEDVKKRTFPNKKETYIGNTDSNEQ